MSRALSTPDKVRPETRQRIADAVAKTGYVVNSFASTLRSGRSTIISVFVSSLQNPHFANALQGCTDALEGSRYRLLMAQTGLATEIYHDVAEQVLQFRPAAVMFTGIAQSPEMTAMLRTLGTPVIELWDYRPDPIDMLVGFPNEQGGRLMGEHFLARGYRRIAFAGRTEEMGSAKLAGFRAGLCREPDLVVPIPAARDVTQGIEAFDAILEQMPDCDAIFFGSDLFAVGALLRARQRGIDVPGDIALAGYGDLDFSSQLATPLTTVHTPSYEMGFAAGQLLLKRLQHEALPERVVISPLHLEARQSTAEA